MEVDDSIIQTQVSKFQRICCNDKDNIDTSSSNPSSNKIGIITNKVTSAYEAERWPSSRIVRVSRASGGKDRHSKVLTSKGLRDRRVRLSVSTAIQFYDLQDRLGYDQPSKAVEWLIKAAASSIAELPSLDQSFVHFNNNVVVDDEKKLVGDVDEVLLSKSYSSSASEETSKGSGGLCLSRSENRIRARERARGLAAAKKDKENNNGVSQTTTTTSSFTDLLTSGGIRNTTTTVVATNNNNNNASTTPMDYFQMEQQFGNNCSQSQQQQQQPHFSFLQENLSYETSSGYNRGTLQSNLMSNNLPHPHHHHLLQRFQPMEDGSTSPSSPFFIAPNMGGSGSTNQFLATGLDSQRLRLYGGDGGGHYYEHHKDKSKS